MSEKKEIIKRDYHLVQRTNNNIEVDNYYMDIFQKRRQDIISVFSYLPHIQEIKNQIKREQIYKAVFDVVPGEGLAMWRDKSGRILPSLKDSSGKIRHQARLEPMPMPMQTYAVFNDILVQNKLEDISEHLYQIDKKVELILKGQHNDRVAIIEGAQDTIQQAMLIADKRIKENLLTNAIGDLNRGRRQLINETLTYFSEFENVPKSKIMQTINALIGSLNFDKMNSQAIIVQKNIQVILEATYYQIMAYDILGEHLEINDITESLIKVDTHNAYIEQEINKWLGGQAIFTFDIFNDIASKLKDYKKIENVNAIELELTGKEIIEGGIQGRGQR